MLELLLVLGLLSVAAVLVFPALTRWHRRLRLDQAASTLQAQLQEARSGSISSGYPCQLVIPTDGHQPYAELLSEKPRREEFQWPQGVVAESVDQNIGLLQRSNGVQFLCHPDGTVTGTAVQFSDAHGHSTILRLERLTGRLLPSITATESPRGQMKSIQYDSADSVSGVSGVTHAD